ncbi:MAG: TatD family hydrolase [Holosporales bacterium]|jgi:TatD DNase family protein|nr:TatD family hydrolase [Holosporales bacterium]
MLVDSHCHLNYPGLVENIAEVLNLTQAQNVGLIVTIGTMLEEISQLEAITTQHDNVYRTVGVHPLNVKTYTGTQEELKAALRTHLAGHKTIAIGEIGLDYHYPGHDLQQQRAYFAAQLEVAQSMGYPACIHTREAEEDTPSILSSFSGLKGVIHCFSGDVAFAKRVLDLGFFVSFSGTLTFPKAIAVREVACFVPNDRILIETDAPFLAPVPHRGRSNTPAFLPFIAQKLAEIRGVSLETIERQTTDNFLALFTRVPKSDYVV